MANKLTVAKKKTIAWQLYCEDYSLRKISEYLHKVYKETISHVQIKKYIDPILEEELAEEIEKRKDQKKRIKRKIKHWDDRVFKTFNSSASEQKKEDLVEELRLRTQLLKLEIKIDGLDRKVIDNNNIDINKILDDMRNDLPASKPYLVRILNKEDVYNVIADYERNRNTR